MDWDLTNPGGREVLPGSSIDIGHAVTAIFIKMSARMTVHTNLVCVHLIVWGLSFVWYLWGDLCMLFPIQHTYKYRYKKYIYIKKEIIIIILVVVVEIIVLVS